MYAGKPNEELKPVGPVEYVTLKDPVYVGLGVCSHVATTLETAIFSNVKLEQEAAAERSRIIGIANIAVKVDNLDEARKFYPSGLGLAEAFHTKDRDVPGDLACFKVNDHQYVEVSPTLKSESEDRLIRIGFETTDAQKLRDYYIWRRRVSRRRLRLTCIRHVLAEIAAVDRAAHILHELNRVTSNGPR
jgi:extradiol dioxygenase family protein